MLLTLFAYRIAYRLFRKFRLAVLIKRFTLWEIVILLLLQGNVEFFFFSFTGNFLTLFSINSNHKFFNFFTILASFVFLTLSTYGFVSLYLIYGKKAFLIFCKLTWKIYNSILLFVDQWSLQYHERSNSQNRCKSTISPSIINLKKMNHVN